MKLAVVTAHAGADTLSECLLSWRGMALVVDGSGGILPAYDQAWRVLKNYEVIAFLHDDTRINDLLWCGRVLQEFDDPTVGLVGFGGALEHGTPGLYRDPYDYRQLARAHFLSNMEDADVHGKRFTASTDVAVLDGFALIVRRSILEKAGGWPVGTPIGYACYDYWLSAETRRQGYKIRVVGISCKHYGGATFVKLGKGSGPEAQKQYDDAHRYIYDTYRDVLPYKVP